MTCRTGCPTKDHDSWGECARTMNIQIGDLTGQGQAKVTDKRLRAYADARRQGVQPAGTQLWQSRLAIEKADRTGVADAHAV